MIHSVSAKNFFSIGDEVTLDFIVNEHAPKNGSYVTTPSGVRLSNVAVIIGANASGKTTVLKMIPFLKFLIVDSYNLLPQPFNISPQTALSVMPFMFNDLRNKPIEVSVIFEIEGKVYSYEFRIKNSIIVFEELKLTSKVVEKKSSKKVYSRTWNENTNLYEFDSGTSGLSKDFETSLRRDTSIVAVASRYNDKLSQEISNFWQKLETNVVAHGWIGDSSSLNQLVETLNFFLQNEQLQVKANKLISKLDLGIDSFEVSKQEFPNGIQNINMHFRHSCDDSNRQLPLQYESTGTLRLMNILKSILRVLDIGGILILDEFDASLHPDITLSLFELFIDPINNSKNAQILFSTHNHQILTKMDKYKIFITEKNEKGMTECWRLDEMEGVRSDDNYYAKYIAGAYGGIPKLETLD